MAQPRRYTLTGGASIGGNLDGAFSEEKTPTPLRSWSSNPSGVLGGIQVGYNFIAASNWLIGIEGELDWTSAQGTVVISKSGCRRRGHQQPQFV
jgi:hypothetical protein